MSDLRQRMEKSLEALRHDLNGLRTGRASTELLAQVKVEAYGQPMPLAQVGTVSISDARTLSIQVWDKGLVASVEKAIREAGLGLNPRTDGQIVRVPLPELTEDRRKELVKIARQYAEKARVSVRNIRRDAMEDLKKNQKDGAISEDDARRETEVVQKATDDMVAKVDGLLAEKEKDIQHV